MRKTDEAVMKNEEAAGLVASIRESFQKKSVGDQGTDTASIQTPTEREALLTAVLSGADTLPYEPVQSRRRLVGALIFRVKRLFLHFLRPVLSMILTNQIEFNENTAEVLRSNDKHLKSLSQDTQFLYHSYESLRLKLERLQEDNLRQKKEIEFLNEKLKAGG